jgi:DNA-binding MarR family transcriptional regulator
MAQNTRRAPTQAVDTVMSFFAVIRRLSAAGGPGHQHPKTWPLLGRLSHAGSMRVADLADFAGLDASTVSRHVRALEDDGLVARDTDPDDRRAASVRITDLGRAFVHEALQIRAQIIADATADWPEHEREQLADLMGRLAGALDPNAPRSSTPTENPS